MRANPRAECLLCKSEASVARCNASIAARASGVNNERARLDERDDCGALALATAGTGANRTGLSPGLLSDGGNSNTARHVGHRGACVPAALDSRATHWTHTFAWPHDNVVSRSRSKQIWGRTPRQSLRLSDRADPLLARSPARVPTYNAHDARQRCRRGNGARTRVHGAANGAFSCVGAHGGDTEVSNSIVDQAETGYRKADSSFEYIYLMTSQPTGAMRAPVKHQQNSAA